MIAHVGAKLPQAPAISNRHHAQLRGHRNRSNFHDAHHLGVAGMAFTVRSNSFKDGDYLGNEHILSADFGFGCAGGNKSPHLAWSGAPAGTKSFAVTCFDPDAPTGSGFWHWLVVNIPADVTELAADAGNPRTPKLPSGALQTRTDFGQPGYGGPCPPAGDHPHRYLFTVFAVGVDKLQVTADTSAAVIGFQLNFNTLGKAAIMGLYKRT
jgi:Raf kinase inhibitor-like YbhB/YbcL family protein